MHLLCFDYAVTPPPLVLLVDSQILIVTHQGKTDSCILLPFRLKNIPRSLCTVGQISLAKETNPPLP